ncbi:MULTISPECIES: cytochrome b5 domain-containing protein [unclassified Jeotgalibaca]|uniref:cytochrome b5 domain-containing protein n=1 Tax=unclassified Jeotgalibaca TaxID=2621505 RepID=UPI003FD62189
MKEFKVLLLAAMMTFVLAACGTTTTTDPDLETSEPEVSETMGSASVEEGTRIFTLDELSEFDGKDGNPAYVAVDGVVYDVTGVEAWANGEHQEGIVAGKELSDKILESPHGKDVLEDLPIVGTLETE